MKIRVHAPNLEKERIINILFKELEVPTMSIFGNGPIFNLNLRERDGAKILKTENQNKLKIKGITVTVPPEVRANRSVFVRRVMPHVGSRPAHELKEEIEKQQDWAKINEITKIKEYTHVFKIEFLDTLMAQKTLETGLLVFSTFIPPENIEKDNYTPVRTCFTCYSYEDHSTPQCPNKNLKICSECAEEGHRWNECRNTFKKCINCSGNHRTLAMSCPVKKEKITIIRDEKQQTQHRETNKKYNEIAKEAVKEATATQPPKTEIVLQHDMSHTILTACILAHLNNIAEPGSFNKHLNYLLRKNNLPEFTAEDHAPSHKIF